MRAFLPTVCLVAGLLLSASRADAQGYLSPSLGATFSNPSGQGRANFGAALGWLPRAEPIGLELDVLYVPSFFGNDGPYADNSVTTAMANVVVAGGGANGRSRFRRRGSAPAVRPYLSGGFGVMHAVVRASSPESRIGNTDLGVNLGVGVMAFPYGSFGFRGDVRYFRDLINSQKGEASDIDFGAFHFWRVGLGFVVAF